VGDSLLRSASGSEVRKDERTDVASFKLAGRDSCRWSNCFVSKSQGSVATYEFLRRFQIGRYLVLLHHQLSLYDDN